MDRVKENGYGMDTEYVLTCYLSKKGKEEKYNAKALLGADVIITYREHNNLQMVPKTFTRVCKIIKLELSMKPLERMVVKDKTIGHVIPIEMDDIISISPIFVLK